jgi:hypothetical protein
MDISSKALFSYLLDDLYADDSEARKFALSQLDVSDYWPGASPPDVAKLRLVRSIFKKLIDETSPDADKLCLEKFLAANERCKNWELNLLYSKDEELFGLLKKSIEDFLHPEGEPLVRSTMDIWSNGRCGPGASLGANGVDFYTKLFSSKLTATSSEVYEQYIEYISWFSDWRDAEINRLLSFGLPKYTCKSSLSFVRKTRDISRSICTEPSLNMFAQLGLGNIIATRLSDRFGIYLDLQPTRNLDLARVGSIDGSVATLDLESASDSLNLGLMEAVLPSWFYDLLCIYRTPFTQVDGEKIELNMISTMGNGFTFPLQTMLFSCVVDAVARWHGFRLPLACDPDSLWGVFGDDIIIPSEMVNDVIRLLSICGFRINSTKSYSIGPFRESCGGDFYQGVNVRGVYLKTLSTEASRYVAINLLSEWSARHSIPLCRSVGYLVDSVRYLAVPPWENLDSGIRVPYHLAKSKGVAYSKYRFYYRCLAAFVPFLSVDDKDRILLPARARGVRRRVSNPEGLLFSFLGGYIRSRKIPLALKQGERPSYRTRVKCAPNWHISPQQQAAQPDAAFWVRWDMFLTEYTRNGVNEV